MDAIFDALVARQSCWFCFVLRFFKKGEITHNQTQTLEINLYERRSNTRTQKTARHCAKHWLNTLESDRKGMGWTVKRVKIGANKTHEHRNTHALTHLRHTKHTLTEQHEYYQHTYKHTCDIKMHTMWGRLGKLELNISFAKKENITTTTILHIISRE